MNLRNILEKFSLEKIRFSCSVMKFLTFLICSFRWRALGNNKEKSEQSQEKSCDGNPVAWFLYSAALLYMFSTGFFQNFRSFFSHVKKWHLASDGLSRQLLTLVWDLLRI